MHSAPVVALLAILASSPAYSQKSRERAWELGAQLLYVNSARVDFNGGSSISTSDELGLSMNVAYRFSPRFDVQFEIDAVSVDYDVRVQADTGSRRSRGTLDAVSPRFSATYSFMDGALTPFVSAGVGWSFVDTNIPKGPVFIDCWWDPWWGRVCAPVQDTRTVDDLTYKAALGLRWDFSPAYTLRFAYEKAWFDFDEATSAPDFDQFKLGVGLRW